MTDNIKILFSKVSYMKYYHGTNDRDIPINGGSYVKEHGKGHEEYNFEPINIDGYDKPVCLGFFETKSNKKDKRNQLHIENIIGCELMKNEDSVDDVLVVWCATARDNMPVVVGWYKHATVYRHYQECEFDNGYIQYYNVIANAENCVLLPYQIRGKLQWHAAISKTDGFGFGQSLQWYAREPKSEDYVKKLIDSIENYDGNTIV